MRTVLFVNSREKNCGVHQYFARLTRPLIDETKRQFYIDIDTKHEFDYWCSELHPTIVIYNHYAGAALPWLSREVVDSNRNKFKQAGIYHELPLDHLGFDIILHQDPTATDTFQHIPLTRPIPVYKNNYEYSPIPIFTSFGFGLGGKGFSRLANIVNKEYDRAIIRLHIPFATFGDKSGQGAYSWINDARSKITKPGIELQATHHFLSEDDLLDLLAQSACNCFFYDENYGRGLSGTLDYALAVKRPFAITKSWQFKHIWSITDAMLIENNSLSDIIAMGIGYLDIFHNLWSPEKLIQKFDEIFMSME